MPFQKRRKYARRSFRRKTRYRRRRRSAYGKRNRKYVVQSYYNNPAPSGYKRYAKAAFGFAASAIGAYARKRYRAFAHPPGPQLGPPNKWGKTQFADGAQAVRYLKYLHSHQSEL